MNDRSRSDANPREANDALNRAEVHAAVTYLRSTPMQINVELTGVCNVNPPCVFCSGKNVGYNYEPLDASYLDRHAAFLDRCEHVNEDSFGEPLSHPQLIDVARRITACGQRFSFVTNGLLLSHAKSEALADLGSLLGVHVSFNAATADTFWKLTGKNFGTLVANVRTFVDVYTRRNAGSHPDLTLTFIVMRINREEVGSFLHLTKSLGARALLAPLHARPSKALGRFGYDFVYEQEMLTFEELQTVGDQARQLADRLELPLLLQWDADHDGAIRNFSEPGVDIPCLIPWRYLHIQQHSGKVYACPYHKRPIGDLAVESLDEIWNGETARDLRGSLAAGRIPHFCWNFSASCPLVYRAKHEGLPYQLSHDITMGSNDYWHLDDGWHALEEIPDWVRWTTGRATFRIAAADAMTLCIRCQSFKPDLKENPVLGYVEIDGSPVAPIRIAETGWQELRVALPTPLRVVNTSDRTLSASIVIQNTWVPAETLRRSFCEPVIGVPILVNGSRDTRRLGIVVQRIWLE